LADISACAFVIIPHQVDAKVDASIIVEVVKFTDAANA
jgi:hypothetical protein